MDLRHLRSFLMLAETLNFSRAAQRLNMTQPPLSRQIAALEASVGTALFWRHSRSVVLTPAGEQFRKDISRVIGDLDFAVEAARSAAYGERGKLTLAFTMYAAWNVLPELVATFSHDYPEVTLSLSETLPRDLHDLLIQGEADIGLSFPLRFEHTLQYKPVFREALCAVVPANHLLAGKGVISAGDLARDEFITFPKSTAPALHEAVTTCCESYGFEPAIKVETQLQQTIVNLVAKGLGVALVPDSMRKLQLEGAVFVSLADSPVIEQGLYWNEHNPNPCVQRFIESGSAT
ncbi:Transcriptional regulator, LysR family [Marinobacter nitratireducens]|uniref:Transcriptional regulator, LysR family n=1 Tax=Marinobacter nitratireducens TaxID=1137280 RepID=A0A072NH50_9GAMM|nr:LysR family transcriptional regulator [Marinobacter nitratireducens]KEF32455.1 Transcriptional regulator, LysR family [Marinobacter nitratireducens]